MAKDIVIYECADHIATIRMNRPEKKNAIDRAMQAALKDAWERFEEDKDAWVGIITGEGNIFSAGADKSLFDEWMETGKEIVTAYNERALKDPYMSDKLSKPTIAAVNGSAFGGGLDMVLRADFRIAAENAKLCLPEANLGGVLTIWDGIPRPIAAEMVCGIPIPAKRAYEVGMLNRIVPADEVYETAYKLAKELTKKPPLAIRKNIQILKELKKLDDPMPREELLMYAAREGATLAKGHDWQEAIDAFLNKKEPHYNCT